MSYFSAGFKIGIFDGLCRNFFGFSPAFTMPMWSIPVWSAPCCCSNPFANGFGFNLGFNIGSGFGIFSQPLFMTPPPLTPLMPIYNNSYLNNNSIWQTNNYNSFTPMDTYNFSYQPQPAAIVKDSNTNAPKENDKKANTDETKKETDIKKESDKKPIKTQMNTVVTQSTNRTKIGGSKTKYDDLIIKYANKYDLDPNLVKAVIAQESDFNPNARGTSGEIGLMQLMPGTANDLGVTDRSDPEQNIAGGAKYLRQLLNRYNNDLNKALAAYNAGMGNVDRHYNDPDNKAIKAGKKYVASVQLKYKHMQLA